MVSKKRSAPPCWLIFRDIWAYFTYRTTKNHKIPPSLWILNETESQDTRSNGVAIRVHVCFSLSDGCFACLPASPNYRMQIGRENQSCGKGIFRSVFDPNADWNRENCIETQFPGRSPFRPIPVNRQKDRCLGFYALLFTLRVSEPLAVRLHHNFTTEHYWRVAEMRRVAMQVSTQCETLWVVLNAVESKQAV